MRRLLSRRVSVGAMFEFLLWMALPYLLVGMVWTFLHPQAVQQVLRRLLEGSAGLPELIGDHRDHPDGQHQERQGRAQALGQDAVGRQVAGEDLLQDAEGDAAPDRQQDQAQGQRGRDEAAEHTSALAQRVYLMAASALGEGC